MELLKNDEMTIGALISLYGQQELDEQAIGSTHHQNARGFNAVDANILTSISQFYLDKGFLTPKQIGLVRTKLPKYEKQLSVLDVRPATIKKMEPTPANGNGNGNGSTTIRTTPPKQAVQKTVTMKGELLEIRFPYDPATVAQVRGLEGRRWNPDGKFWTCWKTKENGQTLVNMGFAVPEEVVADPKPVVVETINEIPGLKMELMPFQKEGVAKIQAWQGRTVVADEMGLGKTAQALAWLQMNPNSRPAVIIVPASLKLNWEREANMWMDRPNVQVLNGRPNGDRKITGDIIVVNYDILSPHGKNPGWTKVIRDQIQPKAIILDEAHYIKSTRAKRTKSVKELAKDVPHIIGLSGTPIVNRPVEFFNVLNLIMPSTFPNFMKYAKRYCGAFHNGFGWDFTGATNTDELHDILINTMMIRRKKDDVLKDLPAKRRVVVPMEINNRSEYNRVLDSFLSWVAEKKGMTAAQKAANAEVLAQMESLKQTASGGKMEQSIEWIRDFLDSGEKLVVFASHKKVINQLMSEFQDIAVKVDGSVSQAKRQNAVDLFQNDDSIRLFVGNIRAAGVGLTLTAASNVAFLEYGWTPGEMIQAEDRCHRIGQKDSVTAWYLVSSKTIEEDIVGMLEGKARVLDQVLDGADNDEISVFQELLNKLSDRS